jgi:CheY-like chemotaxis protein
MAKVLIVDDVLGVRQSLSVILRDEGCDVLEAENGKVAKSVFEQAGGKIDLVITDILMPECDGIELITYLHEQTPRPKIIAVSGGGQKVTAENALGIAEMMADEVLRKPFERDEILTAVHNLTPIN